MKSSWFLGSLLQLIVLLPVCAMSEKIANRPDSVYLFAYGTDKNMSKNGLHFAWSRDKETWHAIGPEHAYVKSDYGTWGSEKRMILPFLFQSEDNMWHCIWSLNDRDGTFAHAASPDLVYWGRQSYPTVMPTGNCLQTEVSYDKANQQYTISWESERDNQKETYKVSTKDFKNYSDTEKYTGIRSERDCIFVNGKVETGTIHTVSWEVVDNLIKAQQLAAYKGKLYAERVDIDAAQFKDSINITITAEPEKSKPISDLLIGIFFEDINYAAYGGLYAELVQNRGFEYAPSDKKGRDKNWNSYKAWCVNNEQQAVFTVDTASPIHPHNKHYAVLQIQEIGGSLINEGFEGIPIKAGEKYDFSVFARSPETKRGKLRIRLVGKNGEIYGESSVKTLSGDWKKYETVITAKETVKDAQLEIIPQMIGQVELDMISLFPQKTFMNRKNGLRADLAQAIADLKPRFVRFPGGCVAHGDGLHNIYRWENTIGELETHKPQRNLWGYHQTAGLGYFEYFQFCEDIGAEPVPVVAAGVPCQNSSMGGAGQQGGIPLSEMDEYIESIFNLIEYANGDIKTEWGRKRAEAGYPKPFNLKYLGVGNEDLITDIFEERFTMIFNAVKEKYPEITVIGTVGPFYEGTDYVEGWELASKLNVPIVDEHYYSSPGWYMYNQDYYDKYDRSKPKVYLGEYAAHVPNRHNNIETALAEALHLANVERNGDVVWMTSYAPLLAKEGFTQWNPDLIYFNNTEVKPTVGYYVQQLYGQNSGDEYIASKMSFSDNRDVVSRRVATSIVKDSETKDVIIKLVNLLPVSVHSSIDLNGIEIRSNEADLTTLQGKPDDRRAKPEKMYLSVDNEFTYSLPAYSFTVIRIKVK